MINSPQIVLAIESAICGGSLSLIRDGNEIAGWIGTSNVSKAEDLLVNIDEMLTANDIRKEDIGLIAVSAGPGSFTGIRIGIATALGMKTGLGIKMSSESALRAMAFSQADNPKMIAAVPMGRNAVCLQTFQRANGQIDTINEPQTMHEDAFLSLQQSEISTSFLLHAALCEKAGPGINAVNFGLNIAYAIGSICRQNPGIVMEPVFVSKSF